MGVPEKIKYVFLLRISEVYGLYVYPYFICQLHFLNSRRKVECANIYFISFQEIVPVEARKVLDTEEGQEEEKWDALIRKMLNINNATGIVKITNSPPSEFALAFMQSDDQVLSV